VAVASLNDSRSLRAALVGIDTVIHLASAEGAQRRRDLWSADIQGTRNLIEQARDAGVRRLMYLSHLAADRNSAFLFLQAKGIVESLLLESGIPSLILRSSVLFGPEDNFTNVIALLARLIPFVFFLPEDAALLQPLWVEDLVACLALSLEQDSPGNEIISIGGPEHLGFDEIIGLVLEAAGMRRRLVSIWPPYLRLGARVLEQVLPHSLLTPFWLEYWLVNRTCEANSVARRFGLQPASLREKAGYLRQGRGMRQVLAYLWRGRTSLQAGWTG
jgi:NADH dehydrogenase